MHSFWDIGALTVLMCCSFVYDQDPRYVFLDWAENVIPYAVEKVTSRSVAIYPTIWRGRIVSTWMHKGLDKKATVDAVSAPNRSGGEIAQSNHSPR